MANWVADFLIYHPDIAVLPVHKRAQHSLHFRRPDGVIVAHFTGAPCHYWDGAHGWKALDTALSLIGTEYGAPGLSTRLTLDGGVRLDKTEWQHRTTGLAIFDTKTGKISRRFAVLPDGHIDGETVVRESGAFRHVLRLTETGLQETLTIEEPLSGTSASEWAILETRILGQEWADGQLDSQPIVPGVMFRPPTCMDAAGNIAPMRRFARKEGTAQYLYTGVPLAWLAGARYPITIDPDYASSTSDGEVSGASTVSYATARGTSTGANIVSGYAWLGQTRVVISKTTTYTCYRAFFRFDTSAIGSGSTVTQVNLTLVPVTDGSDTDFNVVINKQDWSSQVELTDSTAKREEAYDNCLSGTADDNIWRSTSGISINTQYTSGNLSNAWVSRTGYTYYSLISSRDVAGTAPTGYEYIVVGCKEHTTSSYRPFLTVTYTEGGGSGVPKQAMHYARLRS